MVVRENLDRLVRVWDDTHNQRAYTNVNAYQVQFYHYMLINLWSLLETYVFAEICA